MSNLTRAIASSCFTALILLIASIYVHNTEGFPDNLDTALALASGFLGLITAFFGFASASDAERS